MITVSCLKHTKSNTIILAGLSGSGKTTLFYQVWQLLFCIRHLLIKSCWSSCWY